MRNIVLSKGEIDMRIDSGKIQMMQGSLTQIQLAEKAGMSRQALSTILARGTCHPTSLKRIAEALEINPLELIRKES